MRRLIVLLKPYSKYLLAAWAIAVVVVSSVPSLPTLTIETGKSVIRLDYIIHICEYAALAILTYMAFSGKDFSIALKRYVYITVVLVLFAIVDEFHQKLIPGRTFNFKDMASNITGIIAGLIFCMVVFRHIRLRNQEPE